MQDINIDKLRTSYKEVPYFSQAYSNSHPDRMATLGRIFNMTPAPVTNCRVLELGCASGGNIIPMAYYLPESEFVGVELDEGHVASGQKTVKDLGLKNIKMLHGNVLEVDASWGFFDYIICHGVFSWVPESVQEKILSIASVNLSDEGIAYISYNTYPGWHMREMIRHIMLYHANQFEEPDRRIEQAKAFVDFLAGAVSGNTRDPYALFLKNELEAIKTSGDWYIYHDYMEVVNTPIYFHQFIERAERHGLQYLADASFSMMFNNDFSEEVNNTLENISNDIVQKEQYMDFLRNRQFRQTLLCKKKRELKRMLDAESLNGLLVLSSSTPQAGSVDLMPGKLEKFQTPEGMFIETSNPAIKAALRILKQHWPKAISFETLLDKCLVMMRESLNEHQINDQKWKRELGRDLLHCFVSGAINLKSWQGELTAETGEKPEVGVLTKYQVAHHQSVVNQRHETVNLDALAIHLIPMLDGTKTKADMVDRLVTMAGNKVFTVSQYDLPVTDPEKIRQSIDKSVDNILCGLADAGLLVG